MNELIITSEIDVCESDALAINEKKISDKEAMLVFFALLDSLSFEVCNPDAWWLAEHRAKNIAINTLGISEETFTEVMERFQKARKARNKENPMSSMF